MKAQHIRIIVTLLLSAVLMFFLLNKKGDDWEEHVRNGLYRLTADSIPDFDVDRIDRLGIPYTYYPTQNGVTPGNQYNATIVCNYAMAYLDSLTAQKDSGTKARLKHCVQWLQQDLYRNDHYALFRFHWQQPWYDSVKTPFTSGMTSGLALQLFTRTFDRYKDSSLLADAALLLHGFSVPIDSGGFTIPTPAGWWYEEIADTNKHTPRILDGHMFALLGLYDYFKYTGDSLAFAYFSKGAAALKSALPAYDAGQGNICYDTYCKLADKKYQRIITGQLHQLWRITQDTTYLHYFNKFHAPMERPYVYRAIKEHNRSGLALAGLVWIFFFAIVMIGLNWARRKYVEKL